MSAIRFCAVALLAVGLASADTMLASNCGTAPANSRMYYTNTSISCAKAVACQTTACTCLGGQRSTTSQQCMGTTANCTAASACIGAFTVCMNTASADTTCTGLGDLHLALLAAETSGQWNTSTAYTVCKYRTCLLLNSTAGGTCVVDPSVLCPSAIKFVGTMLFYGNFDNVDLIVAKANLEKDLAAFLGLPVKIIRLFLQDVPTRRQAGGKLLVIEFEVEGANQHNAALNTKFDNIRNSNDLTQVLSSFVEQYKAANGGAVPIFVGVSAGLGSSAFSGTGIEGGVANGPSLPTGSSTTPTPGSGPSSMSTPGSGSSGPGSGSGAATQSLFAAVVVAIVCAMLL